MKRILSKLMNYRHRRCNGCNELFDSINGVVVWETSTSDKFYCIARGCYSRYNGKRAEKDWAETKVEVKMEELKLKEIELTGDDLLTIETALLFMARHPAHVHYREIEEGNLVELVPAEISTTYAKILKFTEKYRQFRTALRVEVENPPKKGEEVGSGEKK